MSREWKPGDVAANVHHGYRGIFVPECTHTSHTDGPHWHNQSGMADGPHDVRRPLVVIDPEDAAEVSLFLHILIEHGWVPRKSHGLRDALRKFVAPPTCTAELALGKDAALYRCAEDEGHAGPHHDGTCTWTAKS